MYELLERTRHATSAILALLGLSLVVLSVVVVYAAGWPLSYSLLVLSAAVLFVLGAYFLGDRGVLASLRCKVSEHGARAKAADALQDAAIAAGIAAPSLLLVESHALNAAALGHEVGRRVVITSTATVETLDDDALRAVFAHEIAHIKCDDTTMYPIMAAAVRVGRAALFLGLGGLWMGFVNWSDAATDLMSDRSPGPSDAALLAAVILMMVAPALARLAQVAFMRTREYAADAEAAMAMRDPQAVARALVAMDERMNVVAGAGSATSHMFSMPPESPWRRPMLEVHPPVAARLERLRMANPGDADLAQVVGDYMESRALRDFTSGTGKSAT